MGVAWGGKTFAAYVWGVGQKKVKVGQMAVDVVDSMNRQGQHSLIVDALAILQLSVQALDRLPNS